MGWYIKAGQDYILPAKSLRLSGYEFIDPLLACNVNNSDIYTQDTQLTGSIASIIGTHEANGDISKASVYFTDLKSGAWANVNQGQVYYPSSLGKIPIMIAYYELAENSSSDILNQKITYTGGEDLNASQDIPPAGAIVTGETYTVNQLIEYMIKYSDNNATQLLYNAIDKDTLNNVYGDLGIPIDNDPTASNLDFITPQQIAIMFRVLYNSTYLSRNYSEQALNLMSQSSFTNGIVAGLPSSTVAAHKLGLVGIQNSTGLTTEHELHDCGIVYAQDPYVLCIMTRGMAQLPTLESILANISQVAYQHVSNAD